MAFIPNGNKTSPPELNDSVVKVVVIGERGCGKTSFIRAYYDRHFPGDIYSHNGVRVYPCEIEVSNYQRSVSIFEIPSHPGFFPEQRIPHYKEADVIVFMYAIDDPTSLQMLNEKWIVESINIIESKSIPVVFVGNKKDLQNDQKVIERLALVNQSPVTSAQSDELFDKVSGDVAIEECSSFDLNLVERVFAIIFNVARLNEN